jgi:hypothetical protein
MLDILPYDHLSDSKNPGQLYNDIRNGLAHEYLLKSDAVVNMGTGPCGIEIYHKRKNRWIRFNIITYYNDFMQGVKKYQQAVRTDNNLQHAYNSRMKGKQRLK